MRKLKVFLTTLLLAVASVAFAQNITVKGVVTDASNGEPLSGAAILVKGTPSGTVADIDGRYSITVPANGTLGFTTIGFKDAEVEVKGRTVINVQLEPDNEYLDEVVVVGYGTKRKIGNAVGAVTTIKGDIVKNAASQSPLDLLQGQVAGMQVLSTGGVAGDNSISMKIHGVGSLTTSSEPLFIVDGVQSTSTMVMSMNPNDIASITVLKDASSTSIYGSLGANGVVYVTTKSGHFDEKASVTVHSQWGLTTLANRQFYENMMSGDELKDFWIRSGIKTEEEIYKTFTSQGAVHNTKWHEYMQNLKGLQSQNDVTVEGGSKKIAYLVSASQFHQDGATIGNFYDRYTLRSNVQAHPAEWLKTGITLTGYITKDQSNGNWGDSSGGANYLFGGLSYLLNPLYSPIDPETGEIYPEQFPGIDLPNPNYFFEKRPEIYSKYGLNGSAFIEITPVKGLVIASRVGTDSYFAKDDYYLYPSASFSSTASRAISNYYSTKNTVTNTIEYSASIKGAHQFSVLLGQEGVGYHYTANSSQSEGQVDDRLMNLQNGTQGSYSVSESLSEYAFLSFFGHADYNYKEKYFIDGTVRYDASSRFGKNNRWAPFWAAGLMWKVKNEDFLRNVRNVNDLSLKVSYGTQGNANIGNYERLGLISSSSTKYNDKIYTYMSNPANDNLQWEKQSLLTVTATGRFWNRLDAEVSFYQRKTRDMLMSVPQPYTSGFTSLTANVGSLQNTGVDITLSVDILQGKDYYLKFNTTFNYNAEKITELFDGRQRWEIANTGLAYVVGKPVMFYYPIYAGVDPTDGAPMWYLPGEDKDVCTMDPARVTKEFNEEALTQNTGLKRHEPISGGFGLRGAWRGLSLNVDFSYFAGKNLINNDAFFYANPTTHNGDNQIKYVSDFWTPYNTDATYPDWTNPANQMQFDTHVIEDASFLRLKNLQIGYSLSKKALGNQKVVKGVNFTVTGRNLLTFTKYQGMDPEVDSNLTIGIPGNTLQVLGGVEIKF